MGLLLLTINILLYFITFFENQQFDKILLMTLLAVIAIMAYVAYYFDTFPNKKYNNLEDPEEIKKLKDFLEKQEIKKMIRTLYYGFAMDIYDISWKLEKQFKIKLHYGNRGGNKALELKSQVLNEKIAKILGFKSYQQCRFDRYAYKNVRRYDLI